MSFDSSRSASSAASPHASRKRGRPTANPWSNSAGRSNPKNDAASRSPAASAAANSPASSGSLSRKAPFPDFGSYMAQKNRKLREQFDADASTSSLGSGGGGSRDSGGTGDRRGIFHGVSIFVDGYTVPSSQELKAYMLKHGGRFENYFSRQTVSHIICSHLPDSKMKNLRSFSRGLPVLKPAWVLDSVAANRLLNWVPYQLDELATGSRKQQKLSAFFMLKSSSGFDDAVTAVHTHVQSEVKCTFLETDGCEIERVSDCSKSKDEGSGESDSLGQQSFCEGRDAAPSSTDLEDGSNAAEAQSGPQRLPCANPQHSTSGDLNFVENYFKSSRLHFIGTWRSRYRKRFLNTTSAAQWNKPEVGSLSSSQKSAIIHVDMDCFFVSVVIRNYPELFGKPVAICHSDNARGTSEISSANYPARGYGVHSGMLLRDAKVLCPQLAIFPYNFEAYEEVADQFYTILHENCPQVQAVSCDEAFLDVTGLVDDPEKVASTIRQQIAETTGCTASAGIAGNLLLARLATRSAKPNGQFCIRPEKVDDYLKELPIEALPGIGYSLKEKLKNCHIKTCGQLQLVPKESLQKDFGKKTGEMLWNHCRGIDNRTVDAVQEIKSIGAEVNWGVRFNDLDECHFFLTNLCKEVSMRLKGADVRGRTITLKVKKRKEGAGEPIKYMGCGDCENMSRSMTVPAATDSVYQLFKISKQLFGSFHVDAKEVRGVGLQLSKLESADIGKQGNTLESWFASASVTNGEPCKKVSHQVSEVANAEPSTLLAEADCKPKHADCASFYSHEAMGRNDCSYSSYSKLAGTASGGNQASMLPPMSHLDMDVIKCLPPEIVSEMDEVYHGRLSDLIEKCDNKKDLGNNNAPTMPYAEMKGLLSEDFQRESLGDIVKETRNHIDLHCFSALMDKGKRPLCSSDVLLYSVSTGSMPVDVACRVKETNIPEANFALELCNPAGYEAKQATRSSSSHTATAIVTDRIDLMPASLSQVDESIMRQLPEELKVDLCKLLPAHRNLECVNDVASCFVNEPTYQGGTMSTEDYKLHLWVGNPPKWVTKFKTSNFPMLKILSETYHESGSGNLLSSCLQSLISHVASLVSSDEEWHDEALSSWCEFLRQYIELKVKSDIEELHLCFCILKRLTTHSKFFVCVYNAVLPFLQASVTENYGGMLQLSFDM